MTMLSTARTLIGLMFALLAGSVSAMQSGHNVIEEFAGEHISYRDVFCEQRVSPKNEPIKVLLDEERILFQKFFAQLINSNDSQEFVERQCFALEKQYIDGTLLFATAKNDHNQLLGIMFFYTENGNTEATIQSLSSDNINDKGLYHQLFLGMTQLIKNKFSTIRTIRILESTVPENLKSTLKKLGFKCKFINRKKDDVLVKFSVLQLEISRWDHWCTLL